MAVAEATAREGEDDDHHQQGPVTQGRLHVGDRQPDEIRLAEELGLDHHPCRQAGLELRQHRVEALGEVQGVGPGLLLNGEHDRRIPLGGRRAALDGGADPHLREVGDAHRHPVAQVDDGPGDVIRAVHPTQAIDQILLTVLHQETGRGVLVGLGQGRADLIETDAVIGELHRVDQHLVLARLAARGDHLGHAGHRQQLTAQAPVGDGLEAHQVVPGALRRTQGDEHHLAHDGGHRGERRRRDLRRQ